MHCDINVVILAAGKGTRMKSSKSKVLQEVNGRSMIGRVLDAALDLGSDNVVLVVGHDMESVVAEAERTLSTRGVDAKVLRSVVQTELTGTGSALKVALPELDASKRATLVLFGDVPLVEAEMLRDFIGRAEGALGVLSAVVENSKGYGRIVRDDAGEFLRIVEEKDASDEERAIREINTGIMLIPGDGLAGWLEKLRPVNANGEYYLTDLISMARADGVAVKAIEVAEPELVEGANDKIQLAGLARVDRLRRARRMMADGLLVLDPETFYLRGDLSFGEDVEIGPNVTIEGRCVLGDGVVVEPNVVLKDVVAGEACRIRSFSHLESCELQKNVHVGPFARLRPGARLGSEVKVGNFVEVKNSNVGEGSKISHLTYIGDADMGRDCNIGAGCVTCNYDGVNKHRTTIGNDVFVGSDTIMVAPVVLGDGATTGAGSVVTKDCPPGQLTISRTPQRSLRWKRPEKKD